MLKLGVQKWGDGSKNGGGVWRCPLASPVMVTLEHMSGQQAHGICMFSNALSSTTNFFCSELKCYHWQMKMVRPKSSSRAPQSYMKCWASARSRVSIPLQKSQIAPGNTADLTEKRHCLQEHSSPNPWLIDLIFPTRNPFKIHWRKWVMEWSSELLQIRQSRWGAVLQGALHHTPGPSSEF